MTNNTEPQTATERAREIIRTTLVWNLHAMFGESHDKATEEVIAALHDAGLVIVEEMALKQTADLLNRIGLYRAADGILNGRAETLEELDV